MKPRQRPWQRKLKLHLSVFLGRWIIRVLYGTNRWRVTGTRHFRQPLQEGRSVLIACWHGRLLPVFVHLARYGYYGLAGTHRDAEIISRIGARLGWRLVRGSSSAQGKEAYTEIVELLKIPGTVVALTPDGPKGPAKIPKPGTIRAAQKTGAVIVPCSSHSTRHWGFTNWDTFIVAQPFGRTELLFGKPLIFPSHASYAQCARQLTAALNAVEQQADARTGF